MRLLALVDSPEHVCCRYRIRAFDEAMARAGWGVQYRAIPTGLISRLRLLAAAAEFDAVILQRKLLPGWQLGILRRHARRLIFDFDDAVLYRDSYDPRGPYSRRRSARFAATVRASDAVIAGNDFLADCSLRAGAPAHRVRTVPTCIDPREYPSPAFLSPGNSGEHVDLVWIGSASTLQGLQARKPLWDHLGREVAGLRLRVICDAFPAFDALPVIPIPWSRAWEAADLAAGQIGVSWIPDDPWSRGKCALKVLQYQAAGLPAVANPVGMHAEVIEEGVTGYLADTPGEWAAAIRTLAADPGLRRRMGRQARERLEARYSVAAWSDAFVGAISGDDDRGEVEPWPPRATTSHAIREPFSLRLRRARLGGTAAPARFDGGDWDHE
ncbi:D-inositol-3-phosphate glycosyltransferase [Aquisphaera giovannonii]|uniref:D-inositol-3-phosphate glycosyltransferase n=1 Tax=Aquisphaera giovannonii TaxID=406548 RepID=A0A5B9WBG1_9BACT|nr:glycosyltransferase family 4 protein [Aquisphaera giovannonii]QEH37902.1 D-inositol-3-phosphate glycosyltransferase [Aquisphaera giovannonii]